MVQTQQPAVNAAGEKTTAPLAQTLPTANPAPVARPAAPAQVARPAAPAPVAPAAAPANAAARKPAFTITTPKRTNRKLKMMVYGPYGSGKTTLAASAEDVQAMKDVLVIDAESGDMSLFDRPDIATVQISEFKQLARISEYLRLHCRYRDDGNDEALLGLERQVTGDPDLQTPKKYNTVIIDSLSEAYKYAMYQILGMPVGTRAIDLEPETASFKEWGQAGEMVRYTVRTFRDLPMHVIFVASQKEDEDEVKRKFYKPNFPGQLASDIQGFLDIVGYLQSAPGENGKTSRRLYLEPGVKFQAKHRLGTRAVQYLDNPTMKDIAALAL